MKTKSPHPDWALSHKRPGTELRLIRGHYYLYEVTSKWNPQKKRSQKITGKLLGKITQEGFVESDKRKLSKMFSKVFADPLPVKEYGASRFILVHFKQDLNILKEHFPDFWKDIVSLAFIRLMYQAPIKNTGFYFESSYLSEVFSEITLGEKRTGAMYRKLGILRERVVEYMKSFISKDDHILIDATHIISYSERIGISKMGYNNTHDYDPQINLMLLFSTKLQIPVFYRVIPGNIREVTALKLTLDECGAENVAIIADKGFYSEDNINTLENFKSKYIIPLRRKSLMIDYTPVKENRYEGYFKFQDRYIWFTSQQNEGKKIHLFHDSDLKNREEKDYLTRIETHPESYCIDEFHSKRHGFGTIALFSNIQGKSAQEIYQYYKIRNQVEVMIDAMKNTLMADTSYMQNEEAFNGWMFINFIALQWYYRLYVLLVEKDLLSKYAPKDILLILKEIRSIKVNNQWQIAEYPKKIQNLLEKLNIHIT